MARTTPTSHLDLLTSPAVRPRPTPVPRPLAGVTCPILTAAIRRVEERWVSDRADDEDPDGIPRALAAIGLAVDRRLPSYLLGLEPRPPRLVTQRLLTLVHSELLRSWSEASSTSPLRLLRHLQALEAVRDALEHDVSEQFGAQLGGSNGLDFLVQIVHDLRSPLTSILFLAETLMEQRSGPVNERQHRQLGLIYSAALGLSSLTSDTIELARGGDQLADDRLAPLSVTELLESVCDIVRPIAAEKGLTVSVTLPATDVRLGHALALRRVLLNLTTNALKFTERGSVTIGAVEQAPTRVGFSVRDTGPGINPEALASLFHPFRRSAKAGRYLFSGTGLGLALTRRLVRAMGSELYLETRPGWGTQFWFDLEVPPADLT
ncbi:MAG TPA: HAMP domain-containing sensor histidine kinase [Gemmatimonadales bacterium]|nr:HAMP domain-containing sensor histidine kinase [Gemmatimonadales bacterium]